MHCLVSTYMQTYTPPLTLFLVMLDDCIRFFRYMLEKRYCAQPSAIVENCVM